MARFIDRLVLSLVLLLCPVAGAQTWQNPLPQGNTFRDVAVVDDQVWAVGDFGTLYHSTDTGQTWAPQESGTTDHLAGVSFIDTARGWVCGYNLWNDSPTLRHTTDGGATWETMPTPQSSLRPRDLAFLSATCGYVIDTTATLHRTTDGGEIWEALPLPANFRDPRELHFIDTLLGWVRGDSSCIARTTDGGDTWTVTQLGPHPYDEVHDFAFPTGNIGYAAVHTGANGWQLHKTTNGGVSWSLRYTLTGIGTLSALAFSSATHGVLFVSHPAENTLRTTDGGQMWTPSFTDLSSIPAAMVARGDGRYVAVGESGALLTSQNGGLDWSNPAQGPTWDIRAITFTDSLHGYAVGGTYSYGELRHPDGGVLYTTDGGRHWTPQNAVVARYQWLNDVCFPTPTHGWAVGNGLALYTTDRGEHWTSLPDSLEHRTHFDIEFCDPDNGWIATYLWDPTWGSVLLTDNGGAVWSEHPAASDAIVVTAVAFVDPFEGWGITGLADGTDVILRTHWSGTAWVWAFERGVRLYSLDFLDADTGWVVGDGSILRTTDGVNWAEQCQDPHWDLRSVIALDAQTAWACGARGLLVRTTNGGATWEQLPSGTENTLHDVFALNAETAWAGGANGTLIQYGPLPEPLSTPPTSVHPSSFLLHTFPNPFNAQATITYTLPHSSPVRLAVYDLLGREVAVLTEGVRAVGSYTVSVDGSAWPSGLYLLRLEAGAYRQTQRLLLLR